MKMLIKSFMILGLMVSLAQTVHATAITYNAVNLGGNQWEYMYTITNDTLATDINEFSILFAYGLYENIAVVNSPADWDVIAFDPDLIFGNPDDGIVDALALASGLAPGSTLGGLTVSFNWLGSNAPGTQYFMIFDPSTYEVLDSGNTTPASAAPVPEPTTLILIGTGLLGIAGMRKKFRV